LTVFSLQD